MCRYSDELKDLVWNKATTKEGYNPDQYRLDPCGAWMQKDKFHSDTIAYTVSNHLVVFRKLLLYVVSENQERVRFVQSSH